jgi:hypothetical protein
MKRLEDLFKSALKDQELPYDEGAWNQMSKKLDARSAGASGNFNWIFGAAGILLITVGTLIYLNSDNDTKIKESPKNNLAKLETKPKDPKNQILDDSNKSVNVQPQKHERVEIAKEKAVSKHEKKPSVQKNTEVVQTTCCGDNDKVVHLIPPVYREATVEEHHEIKPETLNALTFNTLSDRCLHDEWVYTNENKESIWINTPSNTMVEVPGSSQYKIVLETKGLYHVGSLNASQEFVSKNSFSVHEAKSSQLLVEDHLNYENGLPQLNAHAYSEGHNTWYVNEKAVSSNQNETSFNLFSKGNYNISLKTQDEKGCTAVSNVAFNVEDDYNLLAVNAFTPSSIDTRNRFFIPFALTQRDTPFTMIVIDPADGAILFETSNADMPWDGTDRNTGKMVDENKSYVWKVILEHPESNEKPEYLGTVVRL